MKVNQRWFGSRCWGLFLRSRYFLTVLAATRIPSFNCNSFRVLLVLEAQDGIVGKSDLVGFPFQPGLYHLLEPFVEYVVKVDVCQEGTYRLPLSRTCFAYQ